MRIVLISFFLLTAFTFYAKAQPGENDPTFNTFGAGIFGDGSGASNEVLSCALQADGKIIIVGGQLTYNGTTVNRVNRINTDGSLDTSFDSGSGLNILARTTLIQPDGKILVGGNISMYDGVAKSHIIRLEADGTLETAFNSGTGPNGDVHTMALQPDNKIIIGGKFTFYNGTSRNFIARINANGTLDASFNPGTGCNSYVWATTLQSDGKILIGGLFSLYNGNSSNSIVRTNANGSIDPTFNVGTGFDGPVYSIAVQSDGKIIVGGDFSSYNGNSCANIARLNDDGTFDSTFDTGGGFGLGSMYVRSIIIQPDGKIIAGGLFNQYNGYPSKKVVRINEDGSIDSSFDMSDGFDNYVFDLALQPDGKVVAVGHFSSHTGYSQSVNRVARLNTDGSLDLMFNPVTGFNSDVYFTATQSDSKIIAGGDFTVYDGNLRNRIVRLNSDGLLDLSFDIGTGFDNKVMTLAIQSDGKILVGGWFTQYNGTPVNKIARLNTDGSLDMTFISGTAFDNNFVENIIIQPDGKILAGGDFSNYNGNTCGSLVRLNTDGSFDATFNSAGSGFNLFVNEIALQPDNKIIVGGAFTIYNGVPQPGFARLHPDGSLDGTFNVGSGFDDEDIDAIVILQDGKILVGGGFYNFNGFSSKALARLNSDGSFDTTFDLGTGFNWYINTICVQDDDKIVVGGNFNQYNGVNRARIARLNSDGSLDYSFAPVGSPSQIFSIVMHDSGKLLVGGSFNTFNGEYRYKMTRINGQCETASLITATECSSYTENGITYTSSGTYIQTIPNAAGCDSTITINLSILNSDTTVINASACNSYTENGQTYTTSGIYLQTLPNMVGCDSTILINLDIQNSDTTINASACNSYTLNGQTYLISGIYTQTLTNTFGCDSLITLNLSLGFISTAINQSDITLTAVETGAIYQWLDCENAQMQIPGANSIEFEAPSTGSFAVEVNLSGCIDTSICISIINENFYDLVTYSSLLGEVFAFPVSSIDTCDAMALAFVEGGIPPYNYVWLTQPNFGNSDEIDSLCEGFHLLKIEDNIGDSTFVNFYVTDTANFFSWYDTTFSSYADTNYVAASNCTLDFSAPLDSASISQFYYIMPVTIPPGDLYFVEITYYQDGNTYIHQDTISIDNTGSYLIYFSVYCPTKNFNTIKTVLLDFNYPEILALNEFTSVSGIQVYPNPTTGIFTIAGIKNVSNIQVLNLLGETVLQEQTGERETTLDISTMAHGIYLVLITNENGTQMKKLIKN